MFGSGETLFGLGETLFGSGESLFGSGEPLFGSREKSLTVVVKSAVERFNNYENLGTNLVSA